MLDTSKRKEKELLFESEHVPVSFLSVDIPKRDPEHISSKDREELIRNSWGTLVRTAVAIRGDMLQYILQDCDFRSENQHQLINQWCFQIPVLGFNSGHYDLKLIKKYFVTHILQPGYVMANKQSKVLYTSMPMFKFLDAWN